MKITYAFWTKIMSILVDVLNKVLSLRFYKKKRRRGKRGKGSRGIKRTKKKYRCSYHSHSISPSKRAPPVGSWTAKCVSRQLHQSSEVLKAVEVGQPMWGTGGQQKIQRSLNIKKNNLTGATLVNKIIQVSSVQFYDTSSVYGSVRPPLCLK